MTTTTKDTSPVWSKARLQAEREARRARRVAQQNANEHGKSMREAKSKRERK